MCTPIILPELGAAPVHVSLWYASPGERVLKGERLVEVLVVGATFDVAAPATGTLRECFALPRDAIVPGQVLGVVEIDLRHSDLEDDE
jgi:pyruvate/2-oxoglutarate dehydrogenase complex dihydrolipoamide acyltransferase (E2) component